MQGERGALLEPTRRGTSEVRGPRPIPAGLGLSYPARVWGSCRCLRCGYSCVWPRPSRPPYEAWGPAVALADRAGLLWSGSPGPAELSWGLCSSSEIALTWWGWLAYFTSCGEFGEEAVFNGHSILSQTRIHWHRSYLHEIFLNLLPLPPSLPPTSPWV